MIAYHPLRLEQTVEVSRVNHRLALGVQWIDALSGLPATGPLRCVLEQVGSRALHQPFDAHPQARHALRLAGRLASLLVIGAAEKAADPPPTAADDQTNFVLRGFARRDPRPGNYSANDDPRQFVPRRLALTPVLGNGVPIATAANIRQAWLWPGAAYPLAGNTTSIRGHVRRGPNMDEAVSVPWVRVIVTRPASAGAAPDFATELQVGWGHGDDRGEFLLVLGFQAAPGGALLAQAMPLRVWVFLPPAPAPGPVPADALAHLPVEQAGSAALNDVLRGIAPPAGYVRQGAVDVTLGPGEARVMSDAALLFP